MRVIARGIVDWWDSWTDNVMMSTLWLFAQISIILGPPATFGVYYVAHELINGQALGLAGMIQGARKHFWTSLLWGLINIVALVLLVIAFEFYGSLQAMIGVFLQGLIFMIGVMWVITQFYTLPYYFMMDPHSLRTAMRNAALTALASPFFAMAMLIFLSLDLILSFGLILPAFLAVPIIIPFVSFRALQNRLEVFGLRKPEKTPQEIEAEMGGRVTTENINPIGRHDTFTESGEEKADSKTEG